MTTVSTDSAIAVCSQASADAADEPALSNAHWRWIPALSATLAPQQFQQPLPRYLSGAYLPRGTYKSGAFASGQLSFMPTANASNSHWLLWSMFSTMSVVGAAAPFDYYYGAGEEGQSTEFDGVTPITTGSSKNAAAKYLAVKRLLPEEPDGSQKGDVIYGARVARTQLTFSPDSPLVMAADLIGKRPAIVDSPTGDDWNPLIAATATNPGYPSDDGVLLGCKGELLLPTASSIDISPAGATLTFVPRLPTVQQQRRLFSYYPDSFPTLDWAVIVQIVITRGMNELYDKIFFGGSGASADWSPTVWAGEPFSIKAETPGNIDGIGEAGYIKFYAEKMSWTMQPIALVPGQIVAIAITGVVEENSNGASWFLQRHNGRDPDVDELGAASVGFMTTFTV